MNIIEIIAKKREKQSLTKEEIYFFIEEYIKENITDAQAAALIMSIYINGMTDNEAADFTTAMACSGEVMNLNKISKNIVGQYSTGGMGDKTTLIIMPIIASLGIPVAQILESGNGIGKGTADKLKTIPEYNTNLTTEEFIDNVQDIGISFIERKNNMAPANKKITTLREQIACTDDISLMAASIMSEKFAGGINKLVANITVGTSGYVKSQFDACRLAEKMISIGKILGKKVICVLTEMNQPIGYSVGNNLEMIETIEALKGNMQEDVKQVVLEIGANIIKAAQRGDDINLNKQKMIENINNNKALEKFIELIENQGGDSNYIKNIEKFKTAEYIIPITIEKNGFVKKINAKEINTILQQLDKVQSKTESKTDNQLGLIIMKKIGDRVENGDTLAFLHTNNLEKGKESIQYIKRCYEISDSFVTKTKTILTTI